LKSNVWLNFGMIAEPQNWQRRRTGCPAAPEKTVGRVHET